jgi:hypothetical protein
LIPPREREYLDNDVLGGKTYQYTLSILRHGKSEVRSRVVTVKTRAPTLAHYQNHPNPFNPATTISFTLPERARVELFIFDLEGKLVRTLVDNTMSGGFKEIVWNGTDSRGDPVSSGVYFCRLKVGKDVSTKKMILLK